MCVRVPARKETGGHAPITLASRGAEASHQMRCSEAAVRVPLTLCSPRSAAGRPSLACSGWQTTRDLCYTSQLRVTLNQHGVRDVVRKRLLQRVDMVRLCARAHAHAHLHGQVYPQARPRPLARPHAHSHALARTYLKACLWCSVVCMGVYACGPRAQVALRGFKVIYLLSLQSKAILAFASSIHTSVVYHTGELRANASGKRRRAAVSHAFFVEIRAKGAGARGG